MSKHEKQSQFECEETVYDDPRPGTTDGNGVCLMNCGRQWPKTLWCQPCSIEYTGQP